MIQAGCGSPEPVIIGFIGDNMDYERETKIDEKLANKIIGEEELIREKKLTDNLVLKRNFKGLCSIKDTETGKEIVISKKDYKKLNLMRGALNWINSKDKNLEKMRKTIKE